MMYFCHENTPTLPYPLPSMVTTYLYRGERGTFMRIYKTIDIRLSGILLEILCEWLFEFKSLRSFSNESFSRANRFFNTAKNITQYLIIHFSGAIAKKSFCWPLVVFFMGRLNGKKCDCGMSIYLGLQRFA
jgi:hypothetical protein